MITRRLWKCPQCGRRWDIPAGFEPESCPKCVPAAADPSAVELAERDVRSFFAPFVAAASVREESTDARRRSERMVRQAEQPADDPGFFMPLAIESPGLDTATEEEPAVFRKRKQRSEIPLGAVVACVAGCVVIVGLIVYQKTKGPTGAAIAIKTAVEGKVERPGAAVSPNAAGKREGRTESAAGKDRKTQPAAGKERAGEVSAPEDGDDAGESVSSPSS
jgi:hypothetical protein